jgi:hypothetical protein
MYNRNNINPDPRSAVKMLTIIHAGLITGIILFTLATFSITLQRGFSFSADPLIIIDIILPVLGIFVGNFLYKTLIAKISAESSLSQKIAAHQTASIVRFALLEGPALFSVVVYMLSGNMLFLVILAVILAYFISVRPTRNKMIEDMKLDYNEQAELGGSSNNPTI